MANLVQFKSCTQAKYNALTTKDANALYFTSDTLRLYKCSDLIAGDIKSFTTLPEAKADLNGILVYAQDTGIISECVSGAWVSKFLPFEDSITDSSTKVPTSHAVLAMASGALGVDPLAMPSGTLLEQRDDGQWVIRAEYNPGVEIKFNNKSIQVGATKLNFKGTVTPISGQNGQTIIQVGQNMNSSSWNTKDGKTDGSVTDISTSTGLLNGTAVNATKTSSNTWKSTGNIHFDEGDNIWTVTVKLDGTEVAVATITDTVTLDSSGNPTFSDPSKTGSGKIEAITHTITSKAREANYPSSVGGMGIAQFTVDFTKLATDYSCKPITVQIDGCGGTFSSKTFYYITGVTPAIATATLVESTPVSVWYSGTEYYGIGSTFKFTATNITNLNNQLTAGSGNKLSFSGTRIGTPDNLAYNNFSDARATGIGNAQNNTITKFEKDGLVIANNVVSQNTVSVTMTATNYYNSASKSATCTTLKPINTYLVNSTVSGEYFKAENYRAINSAIIDYEDDWTASGKKFVSAVALASDQLQVIPGVGVKVPSGSSTVRYFTRKFIKSGSLTGSTITFKFSYGDLSKIGVEILKKQNTWTSVNRFDGTTYSYATSQSSNKSGDYKLVLSFGDTNAEDGYYFRIKMAADCTAVITEITMD